MQSLRKSFQTLSRSFQGQQREAHMLNVRYYVGTENYYRAHVCSANIKIDHLIRLGFGHNIQKDGTVILDNNTSKKIKEEVKKSHLENGWTYDGIKEATYYESPFTD